MTTDNRSIVDFGEPEKEKSIIKVIGVGGGGGNAVNHMYRKGIHDVSFALCNTDNQALNDSPVPVHIQLGKEGLGAGNRPEKARAAAEESIDEVKNMLNDGTRMAFITAGMGGGTGTGAAPVIARVSKSMGILTVGIVTIPFRFEGERKIDQALDGVEEMSKNVDALLVINNERLREIYPELSVLDAFGKADDTLSVAAKSIAEIITMHGIINLDFNDVKTVLEDGGVAIMSTGYGEGENRVKNAFDDALKTLWGFIGRANKYIDETEPWKLGREGDVERLDTVLRTLWETLRLSAILVAPFMPETAARIWGQLGLEGEPAEGARAAWKWGEGGEGVKVNRSGILFPRIDIEKWKKEKEQRDLEKRAKLDPKAFFKYQEPKPQIEYDDFAKLDLRVALVEKVEVVPKADKLYVLNLDLGNEKRVIVSSIRENYKPEELEGKKIIVLCNLKPAKFRGVQSNGMLLAAESPETRQEVLTLLTVMDDSIPAGSKIS